MAGYEYGKASKCKHVGSVWNPPLSEVDVVVCPTCKAPSKRPCAERGKRVLPHATRYMAHHELNCKRADWTAA